MVRVVLVEDDALMARSVVERLGMEGFCVEVLGSGAAALRRLAASDFDVVVLDLGLPDVDGVDVVARSRQAGLLAPIMVVTARGDVEERIRLFELGADDYLVKPFSGEELVARIHALIRRASAPRWAPLVCGSLIMQPDEPLIWIEGRSVTLPARERALLAFLLRHQHEIVPRQRIVEEIFGYRIAPKSNLVEVHMAHLRSVLAGSDVIIETTRGIGYRLYARDAAALKPG